MRFGKRHSEHRVSAFGLLPRCLVLNDIPMLDQNPVFHAYDVRHNPVRRQATARIPPVDQDEIAFGDNQSHLILQCGRKAPYEIKETFATGRDMSTMLNVVW